MKKLISTALALTGITMLSFLALASASVSAANSSSSASVTVADACGLTASVTTPHSAIIPAGTYKADIGVTEFSAFCNDTNGFSVYAVGYSNNEFGNNKLISSINGTNVPTYDIVTGTATSGNVSNWAMKLTDTSSGGLTILNSFNSYKAIPATYTAIAERSSATAAAGVSFQTTYATNVSGTQPAGNYTGKVRYTLVHPIGEVPPAPVASEPGKIRYVPNASGVVDTMADQTTTGYTSTVSNFTTPLSDNSEATLWASNFQRPGYGFAGWNTEYDYSGTTYGPMETITTPADLTTKGLTLYAVWVKYADNMQNWQGCPSLTQGQVTALKDTRDNNVYAVAKLADGNCWMIENMRLGGTSPVTLTPADSNVTSNFTLSATTDPTTTAWCTTDDSACYNQSMLSSNNTTNPVANMDSATLGNNVSTGIYSYGNYYNWYSATAGTGTYSTSTNNASVASSVCPSGWRLPIGGSKANVNSSDLWKLSRAIIGSDPANFANDYFSYVGDPEGTNASKAIRTYPNNFLYSGYVGSSSLYSRGSVGGYWSSTAYLSSNAYYLSFSSSGVHPGTDYYRNKYNGFSVRCLAN